MRDEEIGRVVGSAIGWAAGAGIDGLGRLADHTQDRRMMRLAQDINAAEQSGDYERLLALSTECVRRYPSQEYGHAQLATALAHAGRADEAIAELDRAVELGYDKSEAHVTRGHFLLEAGRIGPAIQEFTAVVHHPEYRPMALIGRVFGLCELEDYEQALADADAAVAAAPDAVTYSIRAGVHRRRNQLEQSLADFTRSIQLDPNDSDVREMRASVYEELGRTDDARADRMAMKRPSTQVTEPTLSSPAAQPSPSAPPAPSSTTSINPALLALLGAALLVIIGLGSRSGGTVAFGVALVIVCLVWFVVRRNR